MRLVLLLSITMLFLTYCYGQAPVTEVSYDDLSLQKVLLVSELRSLEARSARIDYGLGRALAKCEIADAAWTLDQIWATKLLREAYELTFPDEEERTRLVNRAVGAAPTIPTVDQIARNYVRERVLRIASRDKLLAEQLIQLGAKKLGKLEQHYNYADLASASVEAGDNKAASEYILKALQSEPTILNAGFVIFDIAARDRKAADDLIIQYMAILQSVPLSSTDGSALRTYLFLRDLALNNSRMYIAMFKKTDDPRYEKIPLPGPAVLKAYAHYIVESLISLEEREPGSAMRFRGFLLSAWVPLQQYAPELTGPFSQLEMLSRKSGENGPLPTQDGLEQSSDDGYERRLKAALESDQPDDLTINFAISRGDFEKARKMIDKLADGPSKAQLLDLVNTRETLSLVAKDEILEAEIMARRLSRATSILQVYPVIISKCAQKKDQNCVAASVYEAIRQLKHAETTPAIPPSALTSSGVSSSRESDVVVLSLSRLSEAVAPINEVLALEVLDEMVLAANQGERQAGEGRLKFETVAFRRLAAKDEIRVRQTAENLKDPLRQIVALAAVYQWKAEDLDKKIEASMKKPQGLRRKSTR